MGEGGGFTADVADSAGFCRRAAGRMSSAALRTTAGPADSNHSLSLNASKAVVHISRIISLHSGWTK